MSLRSSRPQVPRDSAMARETQLEVPPDVRPLRDQDTVHHHVPDGAVAAHAVVTDHTVLLRAQRLDRALRAEIEIIGAEAHDVASERVEGAAEEQQLAGRIDVRALAAARVPGVPDLHPIERGSGIVSAR